MNANLEIYQKRYTAANVEFAAMDDYSREMTHVRQEYLRRHAPGKVVLDLGCGTGAYLRPILPQVRHAYALDFSRGMLRGLEERLDVDLAPRVSLLEADARKLPLSDSSVDLTFSFTALYHMPELSTVLDEVARTLRPGGLAILEVGNERSFNTVLSRYHHERNGWARPFHVPLPAIERALATSGLRVLERRAFQLFPMMGCPKRLFYLYPFLTRGWRPLMSRMKDGRMLDERLSSSRALRPFAFRHFYVVERL